MQIPKILKIIPIFCAFYLAHYTIIISVSSFLHTSPSASAYMYPIVTFFLFTVFLYITNLLGENPFSLCYYLLGIYLSFLLNTFIFSLLYFIITLIITISSFFFFVLLFICPFILTIYGILNARHIRTTEIKIPYKGFSQDKKRIAHLTDLHLGPLYKKAFIQKLVNKLNEIKPDVIVITGDMADGTLKVKTDWLSPFDTLTVPILYITGNHEKMHGKAEMINAVEGTNIKHIGSDIVEIEGINFIGVDYEYNLRQRLNELKGSYLNNEGKPNVLLSHIPCMNADEIEVFGIFLFLAGHTHCGQVFPMQILVYLANKCFGGLYKSRSGRSYVYVCAGVGTALLPMRTLSSSEIGVITIERE